MLFVLDFVFSALFCDAFNFFFYQYICTHMCVCMYISENCFVEECGHWKVLNAITDVFIVRFSFLWVSLLNAYLQSATYFNVLIAAFLFLFGVCLPCIWHMIEPDGFCMVKTRKISLLMHGVCCIIYCRNQRNHVCFQSFWWGALCACLCIYMKSSWFLI